VEKKGKVPPASLIGHAKAEGLLLLSRPHPALQIFSSLSIADDIFMRSCSPCFVSLHPLQRLITSGAAVPANTLSAHPRLSTSSQLTSYKLINSSEL
jgi:hypothetical protein